MSRGKLLNTNLTALFDIIRPIGSLYSTIDSTFNPNTANGWHGTWERITDCMIYASGDSDTVGEIVGSNTHSITVDEMPSHDHPIPALSGSGGNHTHDIGVDNNPQTALAFSDTTGGWSHWAVVHNGGYSGSGKHLYAISSGNLSFTTNASTTGSKGSGTAIDLRSRRLNAIVWKRTA